jgi:hypothetical protein
MCELTDEKENDKMNFMLRKFSLWQKFVDLGAFLFGASLGGALVFAFAWSFLALASQHYYYFESSDYYGDGAFLVLLLSCLSSLIVGIACGLVSFHLLVKLRGSRFAWLSVFFSLGGYWLLAMVISAIRIWLSVASNSGP